MPSIDRTKAQPAGAEDFNDAYDFLIDDEDTVEVALEIYAVEVDGKRIPKVLDREQVTEAKGRLEKDRAHLLERKAQYEAEGRLTLEDALSVERDLEILNDAIAQAEKQLTRPTTKVTATFQRPGFQVDGVVSRESRVEIFGKAPQWDEHAHVRAVLKNCLKAWSLKQRRGNAVVPVPTTQFDRMDSDLLTALVVQFKQKTNYGVVNEDDEKNA